jgi:DNA polymerase-3 subunit chi
LTESVRVDFYVLTAATPAARLQFACRLTEKAYGRRHHTHAHLPSAAKARELDQLLWTFDDSSFIPHELSQRVEDSNDVPVTIGFETGSEMAGDFLINLANEIPPFFDRFNRIAEIIDASPDGRQQGRERFSFYRDNGYAPNTHKIDR